MSPVQPDMIRLWICVIGKLRTLLSHSLFSDHNGVYLLPTYKAVFKLRM